MLIRLRIQNLVLVEKEEIIFGPHLNVITGESGAGKSAILSAIRLICGARAEIDLIRNGSEMAVIEAEIRKEAGESFWVRRELYSSGKSRSFIDEELLSLSHLKEIVGSMIELVDQSSAQSLGLEEEQRSLLDTFLGVFEKISLLKTYLEKEKGCREELERLSSLSLSQTLEWAQKELDWIEKVNWQKEEEEALTQEHNRLIHSQELKEKIESSSLMLDEASPLLKKLRSDLEMSARFDSSLQASSDSLKSCSFELDEVRRFLTSYADQIETDPKRLLFVEERIGALEGLKRRFGSDWGNIQIKREALEKEIESFSQREEKIECLSQELTELSQKTMHLAQEISALRKKGASIFAERIGKELKSLNLPLAQFTIQIGDKPLSSSGIDKVEFLFSANPGLSPIPIEACASGGELSRLLLAMKIVLAEKEKRLSLIFDEIDSNVGGQTAAILGEKLKGLSEKRQVICVTHFVQVAKWAENHFAVCKNEERGKVRTAIEKLTEQKRQAEYTRMLGL